MPLLGPDPTRPYQNAHASSASKQGNRHVNGTFSSNPAFDSRITTLPGLAGAPKLQRGLISNRSGLFGQTRYGLKFLYNPSVVNVSHMLDMSSAPIPTNYKNPDDTSSYIGPVNSSLSFDLLFDRTYELWDSSYANSEAGTSGVYADVSAAYRMLGMLGGPSGNGDESLITAQMLPIQQLFQFGNYSKNPAYPGSLKFLGYITELDISYTHWTEYMVPSRCTMSFSVQLLPNVSTYNTGSDSTGTTSGATSKAPSKSSTSSSSSDLNTHGPTAYGF